MELEGKVAIVTGAGGAGPGGLGVAYARALANEGAAVAVVDIDGAAADRTAAVLLEESLMALPIRADVTSEQDIARVVATTVERFGGVDILVNNAGLARDKWNGAIDLTAAEWAEILALNTAAPALLSKACRSSMVTRGGGCIVNQASSGAYLEAGAYGVSKLGLVALTVILSAELAGDNIRVNAIAPGMMTAKLPPDDVGRILDAQKIRRLGTPEDLIGALLYLCTPRSSFVTGQTILVDGGLVHGHV